MKKQVVYQEELSDCGVACLLSIIRYYSGDANLEELRIESNTTIKGVNAYDLIECAKKNGFNAAGYKDYNFNNYKLPCIVHFTINESLSHFVVLYEIKDKYFLIMDPAKGLIKIDKQDFKNKFTGNIIVLEPRNSLPKKKNINVIKREIKSQLIFHHPNLIKIITLEITFILLSVVSSFYIKIYNYPKYIIFLSIACIIINIMIEIVSYLIHKETIKLDNSINSNLSNYFFNHILNLPLKYLHLKDPGEIVKRANEISLINELVINSFLSIVTNSLVILSVTPFLLILDKQVLLIIIVQVAFLLLVPILIISKLRKKSICAIDASTEHNNALIDGIYGLTSIKHSRSEKYLKDKIKILLKNKITSETDYNLYFRRYETIKSSLLSLTRILINIYLINKIYKKEFSFENMLIIISFIEIVLASSSNIVSSVTEFTFIKNLFRKANDFYNINEKQISNQQKYKYGDIKFNNINYTYHSNHSIITNFTTTIKKGEKVIIKGESGKGKSTLCKLLYREIEPCSGIITIAGKNIKKINLDEYHRNVTYSSQTERIMSGTIKDNIILGKKIDDNKLETIADLCEIKRITDKRAFGINTQLFSGGEELSGGERQLIILARTLINDFDILILDETLSEVNDEIEDKILKKIFLYFKDKTIIYVTHKNNKNYFGRIINV